MDLKPDNLCMEMKNGQLHPYVVDFGSSLKQDTSRFTSSCLAVQAQKILPGLHLQTVLVIVSEAYWARKQHFESMLPVSMLSTATLFLGLMYWLLMGWCHALESVPLWRFCTSAFLLP